MPGYSGTPRARKLGVKPGTKLVVVGDVPDEYSSWLGPLPEGTTIVGRSRPPLEAVHVFVTKRAELAKHLAHLRKALGEQAALEDDRRPALGVGEAGLGSQCDPVRHHLDQVDVGGAERAGRARADVQHTQEAIAGEQRNAEQRSDPLAAEDGVDDVGLVDVLDHDRLPPGRGIVPFREFFALIARSGYAGYCSYEAPNPAAWARDPLTVAREALEATRAVLP